METFNIQRVKQGKATVALGNPCRIICTDLKSNTPIVVAIEYPTGEKIRLFDTEGYCAEANLRLVIDEPRQEPKPTKQNKPKSNSKQPKK